MKIQSILSKIPRSRQPLCEFAAETIFHGQLENTAKLALPARKVMINEINEITKKLASAAVNWLSEESTES